MKQSEFIEIVKRQWESGSFLPLFCGTTGCEAALVRPLPVAVPTDWSYVTAGIYALYRQCKDARIPALCKRDIESLLKREDPFSVWCGYNAAFPLLRNEREGRAPFSVMDDKMLGELRFALTQNREKLRTARIWQGANAPEGLWTQIAASANVLERKYGIHLVDELTTPTVQYRGTASSDMAGLLERKLGEYVSAARQKWNHLPRAVRMAEMDVPRVDANYGSFGEWKPERAHTCIPKEELEKDFGSIDVELYDYYKSWRFAALELRVGELDVTLDPIYENASGQTSFFFTIEIRNALYFKIGTARVWRTGVEYTLLFKQGGGVFLLEDGQKIPFLFAETITALLENAEAAQ